MHNLFLSVLRDLSYAVRGFLKEPGFVCAAVISAALGIAANTTVFTMVNATLLGELPVPDAGRLVNFDVGNSISYLDYLDYRDQTNVFSGVCAYFPLVPASLGGAAPERIYGQLTTANYFPVLGLRPVLGRDFLPEEDKVPGRDAVLILSNGLWRRRFGADPNLIGRQVMLNGMPFTVVGIAPPGFRGEARGFVSEFWMPVAMHAQIIPELSTYGDPMSKRGNQWLCPIARLKPGVSREQAQAAVNVVKDRIERTYGNKQTHPRPLHLATAGTLPGEMSTPVFGLLAVLTIVVGLVLLIACANIANLLLARATARQKEIGIRLSIGAGRGRLIRQLLTESILLALFGAGAGFLLSLAATRAISQLQFSLPFPISFDFSPDARVFCFTAALSVVTGILFGLAPAWRASRTDLVATLKGESAPLGSSRRLGMRNVLVVVQVSLSLVLLVGAVLFLRSLQNASSIDLGMRVGNIAVMAVDPKLQNYSPEKSRQFMADLRERVSSLPGVMSVSFADVVPLSLGGTGYPITADGTQGSGPRKIYTDVFTVGTRYFETMGIPILQGHDFDLQSGSKPVVILNQNAAAKLFPGENAVGREILDHEKRYEVQAVVANAKSRTLGEGTKSCIYHFLEYDPKRVMSFFGLAILVKTTGNATGMLIPIRNEIQALDRNLAVFNVETMQEHVNKAMVLPRLSAALLGTFGTAGLVLAAVGLYGVMSYSVRRRTREIGIRMSLGAPVSGVLGMVTRQGMMLTGVGVGIGLAIALVLSRFLASLLYGISATDPLTFIGVPLVLVAVAFVATVVPARRASRVSPWAALRHE